MMVDATQAQQLQQNQDAVYALAGLGKWLYAARQSGLYRSADGGATWQDAFASLAEHSDSSPLAATALAVHGEATVFAGVNGAVLRSDDAGEHWHIGALASPVPLVVAVVLSPDFAADGVIAAGTAEDGVFVSTDGGLSWVGWNFGLLDHNIYAVAISPDFKRDNTLFVGTESGIFKSHTRGRSWSEVPFPMTAAPVLSLALSPTYAADTTLYAGTAAHGLFLSVDAGASWQSLAPGTIMTAVNAIQVLTVPSHTVVLLLEDRLLRVAGDVEAWEQPLEVALPAGKLAMCMNMPDSSSGAVLVGFADGTITVMRE
jgi:photosystem II stability/assembly factor-like uncharacterized protein